MASTAESINPMDGLWSLLAYMLRKLRQQHRQSQADVGRLVAADHKTVSNWEAGRNHPPVEALRVLDLEWKTGGLLEALRHYAKTMQAPAQFLAFVEYESLADVIRINGVAFLPGLLQTPEYAREAFTLAGESEVDDHVRRRMERQVVLTRKGPPYVSILLSELALTVIPPHILPGQLDRIAEVADLPNVTLRLVPAAVGLQVGLAGDFYLFTTSAREVGFIETPARGRLVTEIEDLRRLNVAFDRTSGRALTPEATRARLQEMIEAHQ
ncbi:helix-turn-helix domain-containing protein [Actinomadura livida]|uniref:Helix-turn-helix transcriptional regulator n=1 Tax=Actinomadura livida TaxID=79909 RepID=A0A7W7N168_9ACTN|nr:MULTISPECIES: helix-turn-helix transcriptional regulator [Actinomadura]MBB4778731.1 transcriptional regulator with XRE-family HTH domain [Actinomadura catellatispora]GGU36212.1 transcriptional regulator [Actinomadura livida]